MVQLPQFLWTCLFLCIGLQNVSSLLPFTFCKNPDIDGAKLPPLCIDPGIGAGKLPPLPPKPPSTTTGAVLRCAHVMFQAPWRDIEPLTDERATRCPALTNALQAVQASMAKNLHTRKVTDPLTQELVAALGAEWNLGPFKYVNLADCLTKSSSSRYCRTMNSSNLSPTLRQRVVNEANWQVRGEV